jgi:hypothetical protein
MRDAPTAPSESRRVWRFPQFGESSVRQSDWPDSSVEKLKGKYPEQAATLRNGSKNIKP